MHLTHGDDMGIGQRFPEGAVLVVKGRLLGDGSHEEVVFLVGTNAIARPVDLYAANGVAI